MAASAWASRAASARRRLGQPSGDGDGDLHGVERTVAREEWCAGLVRLADHAGAMRCGVEQLLELALDQPALLLDDQRQLNACHCPLEHHRLERVRHAHLVDREPDAPTGGVVQVEQLQRRHDVQPGLARGDDAQGSTGRAMAQPVEPVGASEGAGRLELGRVHAPLELAGEHTEGLAGVEVDMPLAGHHLALGRGDDLGSARLQRDGGGALDRVVDAFQRHPAAREARHGDAEEPVVEDLGDAGRVEHRHHGIDHGELGLVGRGRALADMVVAEQQQHATLGMRAEEVTVADGVARAIDARPLAVPEREDTVIRRRADQLHLLGALTRGGGQILVDGRLMVDVVGVEQWPDRLQRLVEGAQGRAAIARDVAGRVPAARQVAAALLHGQPNQGLHARQIDPAVILRVFVVEADVQERRQARLPDGCGTDSSLNAAHKARLHPSGDLIASALWSSLDVVLLT